MESLQHDWIITDVRPINYGGIQIGGPGGVKEEGCRRGNLVFWG